MSESEHRWGMSEEGGLDENIATSNRRLKIRIAVGAVVVVMILNVVATTSVKMETYSGTR